MRAILHCIRHAEGQHNLRAAPATLTDPPLTPTGTSQCLDLRTTTAPIHPRVSLITASPMTRTLQTAHLAFEPALRNGHCKPHILGFPDAQEVCDYPFNTGSDVTVLRERVAELGIPVDLTRVSGTEGWNVKIPGSRYFPSRAALEARARDCRREIWEMACEVKEEEGIEGKDPEIVLVAHGGFLHFLTRDWEDAGVYSGTGWRNAEIRSYYLQEEEGNGDGDVALVETEESRRGRGKGLGSYSAEEQEGLFERAMREWEAQGLHEIS